MTNGPCTSRAAHTSSTENAYTLARDRIGAYRQAVFTKTFPRLKFIGAFFAVALLLVSMAPAHAQETVLVSNTGKSNASDTVSLNSSRAQAFTTGNNTQGYDLGSIELQLAQVPGDGTLTVSVREVNVWSGTGNADYAPGDTVYELMNPTSLGTGLQKFSAPDSAYLDPNTSYFVYLHFEQGIQDHIKMQATTSNGEDAVSANDWSIGDLHIYDLTNGSGPFRIWFKVPGQPLKIRVNEAENIAPTSASKTVTTNEDEAYTFEATDFHFSDTNATNTLDHVKITSLPGTDEGSLSLDGTEISSVIPPPQVWKADLDDDNLTYTPAANANGSAVTTFKFKVHDGTVDSDAEYTITIDVDAVNDAGPTSNDKTVTTNEDEAYTFAATDFDFSDIDPEDTLDHVKITSLPGTDEGSLSLDGTEISSVIPPPQVSKADLDDDKLTYTPPANANGSAITAFKFKVHDGTVDGDAEYTITIDVDPVNDAPVAVADDATTNKDTAVVIPVLANDSDVDKGTTLSVSAVGAQTAPRNGTVGITDDNATVTYTPTPDYTGTDTFSYTVSDGATPPLTDIGMVTVTVTPNADLWALTISAGRLTPPFTAKITDYTASVAHTVSHVRLEPLMDDDNATVTVNGTEVDSGGSFDVFLMAGRTTEVKVTVTNGDHTKTYTINIFRRAADRTRPSVAITTEASAPVTGPFAVTITFSEAVTGFEPSDLQVTNGTVTSFSGSGKSYTAEITPSAIGQVKVEIGENVTEDAAGNGNQAAKPFSTETALAVSYADDSYTVTEGGDAITVAVRLSVAGNTELGIPIRVTRSAATEVEDYSVAGLQAWDAVQGAGSLVVAQGATEGVFTIAANHDGDGDDETVQLGFGELPVAVILGKPGTATVTLEDGGLVELTLRFAQAAYEINEGQTTGIEVMVSPAADRRVEAPLVVALQGGATSEDYRGVPASVVFAAGEREGTIAVTVLADEENDPGEGLVLSFGTLPEAVSESTPSVTAVTFVQRRSSQQFARSLEGMLAVLGRAMGSSAQTAIEGRFARYRQWRGGVDGGPEAAESSIGVGSRHGPVLALNGSASRGEGSSAPSARRDGDSERGGWGSAQGRSKPGSTWPAGRPGSEPSDSWLRSLSLGSLGHLVRFDPTPVGADASYPTDRTGRLYGPQELGDSRLAAGSPGLGETDFSEVRVPALRLAEVAFERRLGSQESGRSWLPVVWAQGDRQAFDGDLTRIGLDYRGSLNAAHVGLDLYANARLLAGLLFMHSWGELDYSDDGVAGELASRLNTFHPYLYWQPSERLSVWGLGGLGRGGVEVREAGRRHDFESAFGMFSGGVRAVLSRRGSTEWGMRADTFRASLSTGALEDLGEVSGSASRSRLLVEWVYDRRLSAGRSLRVQVEAGGRMDGGEADRGSGLETGLRVGYLDAPRGLEVALQGRVLVVHESDYRDWGLGVQASWDPGAKKRGLRVSVASGWGRDGGGRTTLWEHADVVTRPGGPEVNAPGRVESEVSYCGLQVPGLVGLLTPYSRLRWSGAGREVALGTAWSLSGGWQHEAGATVGLEGLRRESRTGEARLEVMARLSLPF